MSYDTQRPYLSSFLIFRKGNKVAFILRSNTSWMNNHYSLPAGKVEKDESFMDCAIREALEETAVKLTKKQLVFSHVQHRNYDGEPWIDVYYEVVDCDQEPVNNEPHMHSELKWFDVDDLPANLVPGMREVFESIKEEQKYSEVFFN